MTRSEEIVRLEAEYAVRRADDERDRLSRVEDARRDPEIARLLDENARMFENRTARLLRDRQNAQAIVSEMKEDVARNHRAILARLKALNLPEDYLELRPQCVRCGDTGYAGEDRRHFCACFEQELNRRCFPGALGRAEHGFELFDPAVFPSPEQLREAQNAAALCARYADAFPHVGKKLNLVLVGGTGLGKTFLLDSVARRVREHGYLALRVTAFQMLEAMRAFHLSGAPGDEDALIRLMNCPLLLVDDLGTEPLLRNITVEYLFMLLNERLTENRPTVVATNLMPDQLGERYGERVLSRLMDRMNGEIIRLTGSDLRYGRKRKP